MAKKERKMRGIVSQVILPLIIIELVIIFISIWFLVVNNMRHYMEDSFYRANEICSDAAATLESYESLGFLVPYWEENYDKMELIYSDSEKLTAKEKELREKEPGFTDAKYVTSEEAEKYDEESQKLLAEIAYSELCGTFDIIKQAYEPLYMSSFVQTGDNELMFLITGVMEGDKRVSEGGDVFEIGSIQEYYPGVYPVLDRVLETKKPVDTMEYSQNSGADKSIVHSFYPVYYKGEFIMGVSVSIKWRLLISDIIRISLIVGIVIAVLFIVLGFMFFLLLRNRVVAPIRKEQKIINEYKNIKNSKKAVRKLAKVNSNNEIEELAIDFSSMIMSLEKYMEEIKSVTAEKERISAELNMATQIQAEQLPSIFPPFPERHDFDIYASMTPAKEVGGDFYDFFMIDNDHLGMVMADVSGKGVPAALFMMMSKIIINNYAMMGLSPREVLERSNETICLHNENKMFVTVWFGILELSTGKVTAANAGHEYPIIRQPGGEYQLMKDKHGFVIGGMDGMKYKEYEFTLERGGTLFVYTDGVPEATNANEELYGTDRLIRAMNTDPTSVPKDLLEKVHGAVNDFVGDAPQFDDLTMLAVTLK